MFKHFPKLLTILVLCIGVFVGLVVPVRAQGIVPPPTATQTPVSTPVVSQQTLTAVNSNIVTLAQLRQSDIQLIGPYDAASFAFALPADWSLNGVPQLSLSMGVSFNTITTLMQGQSYAVAGGGTLTVRLNSVIVATIPLNQVGDIENNIPLRLSDFDSIRSDGRMLLQFTLDSGAYCLADQHMQVNIHLASYFNLPHGLIPPVTDLVNFPRPIYQNSFIPDSALLVIPDQPSAEELQSALTIAATLGSISSNAMALEMTTVGKFDPYQQSVSQNNTNHVIFVGKASSLPILSQLQLPLSVAGSKFQIDDGSVDDGVVEMINSPWNAARVVLVVSGNTNQGIIKAAQAVSTGVLRPYRFPNLAIVQQVQTGSVSVPRAVDQTLADLGYAGNLFSNRGADSVSYIFNVPQGMAVGPDAYFNLVFGHSALLNYNRSEIVVMLNNKPVGSVRMSDTTANQPKNDYRILIPASEVVPGNNRIDVIVNIVPVDDCTPPTLQGLWINIWSDSLLHLPLTPASVNPVSIQDLASYPAPFTHNPLLGDTAVVLEKNDLLGWNEALHIVSFLGQQVNGSMTQLSVFYGDNVPEAERSKYNFLIIGRPSQLPIVREINNKLPAPFSANSDLATETSFQVNYQIPPDSPMGYVEMLPSPWNPNNVMLAILGNTPQGLGWATSSLMDPSLRSRLAGNFAAINNRQVVTTNTYLSSIATGDSTIQATNIPVTQTANTNSGSALIPRPVWVLPALLISVILIILILAIVVIGSWLRNRTRLK